VKKLCSLEPLLEKAAAENTAGKQKMMPASPVWKKRLRLRLRRLRLLRKSEKIMFTWQSKAL